MKNDTRGSHGGNPGPQPKRPGISKPETPNLNAVQTNKKSVPVTKVNPANSKTVKVKKVTRDSIDNYSK